MNPKKLVLIILYGFILQNIAHAQSDLTIDNVYNAYLRNSGPIIEKDEIKGYYLFYQADKIDRKTNAYTLQILDENLNKVKDISFTDSKDITLKEGAFNGTDLLFVFFDEDQKLLEYRSYGIDGKENISYQRELDKKTIVYMKSSGGYLSGEETQNKTLFSIENKGFIADIPLRNEGDYTYEVSFYQTDKKKQWVYTPDENVKFAMASYLGSNDSVAIFEVLDRDAMLSQKVHTLILGIYLDDGKKAFEFETDKDQYTFYPMNIGKLDQDNNLMLIGPYFHNGDNVIKDNSLGLGVWIINNQGKIITTKYNSWETDFSKYLSVNSNGKVDDVGYIYFHRILQTSDGKIFAIGEGYKKVVSALGIGFKMLAGSGGAFKLKITDMVLLQLDRNFNVKDAEIYTKNSNNIEMPGGSEFMGPQLMAMVAEYIGGFDYSYTETDINHTTFVVGYTDYVRSSNYKGATFNTITYFNNKLTTDKINLKSQASDLVVLPGKTGTVAILEYFKKDKKLSMHIEKMN